MFERITILLAIFGCAFARTTWKELDTYTFEQYVQEFGFEWTSGSTEWATRKSLFYIEIARVRSHNVGTSTWKEGVNKFSAMSESEKKTYRGRSKGASQKHQPKHLKPSTLALKPVGELPARVDHREARIVTPVKDQGSCGSCWAFASTAVVESHVAKASGLLYDLSVHQMAMCSPNPEACGGTGGCEGSTTELAFDYVANSKGMYQEFQYGYDAYRGKDSACAEPNTAAKATISGYVKLAENNYTQLMNAVATVGPVAISVDASWSGYESGIWNKPLKNPDIDHAVVLVGYGEENGQKYWLVRNSWAPDWGEAGYIRIARSDDDETNCAMDVTPQDGTACAGDNTPVLVCGTSGILYDSAYPVGAKAV